MADLWELLENIPKHQARALKIINLYIPITNFHKCIVNCFRLQSSLYYPFPEIPFPFRKVPYLRPLSPKFHFYHKCFASPTDTVTSPDLPLPSQFVILINKNDNSAAVNGFQSELPSRLSVYMLNSRLSLSTNLCVSA